MSAVGLEVGPGGYAEAAAGLRAAVEGEAQVDPEAYDDPEAYENPEAGNGDENEPGTINPSASTDPFAGPQPAPALDLLDFLDASVREEIGGSSHSPLDANQEDHNQTNQPKELNEPIGQDKEKPAPITSRYILRDGELYPENSNEDGTDASKPVSESLSGKFLEEYKEKIIPALEKGESLVTEMEGFKSTETTINIIRIEYVIEGQTEDGDLIINKISTEDDRPREKEEIENVEEEEEEEPESDEPGEPQPLFEDTYGSWGDDGLSEPAQAAEPEPALAALHQRLGFDQPAEAAAERSAVAPATAAAEPVKQPSVTAVAAAETITGPQTKPQAEPQTEPVNVWRMGETKTILNPSLPTSPESEDSSPSFVAPEQPAAPEQPVDALNKPQPEVVLPGQLLAAATAEAVPVNQFERAPVTPQPEPPRPMLSQLGPQRFRPATEAWPTPADAQIAPGATAPETATQMANEDTKAKPDETGGNEADIKEDEPQTPPVAPARLTPAAPTIADSPAPRTNPARPGSSGGGPSGGHSGPDLGPGPGGRDLPLPGTLRPNEAVTMRPQPVAEVKTTSIAEANSIADTSSAETTSAPTAELTTPTVATELTTSTTTTEHKPAQKTPADIPAEAPRIALVEAPQSTPTAESAPTESAPAAAITVPGMRIAKPAPALATAHETVPSVRETAAPAREIANPALTRETPAQTIAAEPPAVATVHETPAVAVIHEVTTPAVTLETAATITAPVVHEAPAPHVTISESTITLEHPTPPVPKAVAAATAPAPAREHVASKPEAVVATPTPTTTAPARTEATVPIISATAEGLEITPAADATEHDQVRERRRQTPRSAPMTVAPVTVAPARQNQTAFEPATVSPTPFVETTRSIPKTQLPQPAETTSATIGAEYHPDYQTQFIPRSELPATTTASTEAAEPPVTTHHQAATRPTRPNTTLRLENRENTGTPVQNHETTMPAPHPPHRAPKPSAETLARAGAPAGLAPATPVPSSTGDLNFDIDITFTIEDRPRSTRRRTRVTHATATPGGNS
jgi:hypothetical protein